MMRKFITNIILFSSILLSINVLLYLAYKNLYLDEYIKTPKGFKSYLLSDSHGLPLDEFTEEFGIYNFSAGSESYLDMKRKLNYIIKQEEVDTVFIQVEGQVLSDFREQSNNEDRSIYYASNNDYQSFFNYFKDAYINYYIILLNPKSQSLFKYYLMSKIHTLFEQDEDNAKTEWSDLSEEERKRLAFSRAREFYSSGLSESQIREFKKIIELSDKNNIVLIGIKYPLPEGYLEILQDTTNHTIHKNYQKADSLLQSYNLKVLDFEKAFSGSTHLYRDEDHLSTEGGRLLADTLKTLVRNNEINLHSF